MAVSKVDFPNNSILYKKAPYHYTDSFSSPLVDPQDIIRPADAVKAFFTSAPAWVGPLFTLRNKLVSLVGLKGVAPPANKEELLNAFTCQPGEQLGLFKVFTSTDQEMVLGEDDKHLDFRVSLLLNKPSTAGRDQKELIITTTVVLHNWLGRLYFLPIKPFHLLIVPLMLKGIVRQLEKQHKLQRAV